MVLRIFIDEKNLKIFFLEMFALSHDTYKIFRNEFQILFERFVPWDLEIYKFWLERIALGIFLEKLGYRLSSMDVPRNIEIFQYISFPLGGKSAMWLPSGTLHLK